MDQFEMKPRNISISVFENKKEQITSSSNESQTYIILQNEELNNQNKQFVLDLQVLENKNNELEEQNDKMENSTRYMRGILHNFNQKVSHQKNIIKYYKEYHSSLKEFTKPINGLVKKINNGFIKFPIIYNIILILSWLIGIISIIDIITFNVILMLSFTILTAFLQIDYNLILAIENKTTSINEIQKGQKTNIESLELKNSEIDKSNNFIEDYIDVV
jgi:hypothetical protein